MATIAASIQKDIGFLSSDFTEIASGSSKVTLNGVESPNFLEYYVEPDGTIWEMCLYHNNPTAYKFDSTDNFARGVYKDSNRYFNFNVCNTLSEWEFLWMQKDDITSPLLKWRWLQTANPFNATWEQVSASSITRRVGNGYEDSTYGGIYKFNSQTYFCANNGIQGNWWGAAGSWGAHNGGIPGYNSHACKSGYIKVFVKVPNTITRIYKNVNTILSNNFMEETL